MGSLADIKPYKYMYVDAMNTCARSYYGLKDLSYNGRKTGMLYGVIRLVIDWYTRNRNIKIIFIWEGRDSWRKEKHPIYKSNRQHSEYDPNDEFSPSLERVKASLSVMGVDQVWADTYEADDTVYSISTGKERKIFVSNDWDWWPLVYRGDILYTHDILNHEDMKYRFAKKYNCESIDMYRLWLFKVLTGDPSDGVPGVPRFRKKMAAELANDPYVTIDNIPEQLIARGQNKWGEVVKAHDWLLRRNYELLLPRPPKVVEIETIQGNYSEDGFEKVLLKSGMADMFERLPRGKS